MTATADRRVRNAEAAEYLGCSPRTLDHWRSRGRGPKYLKVGTRVLYRISDLDAFVREVETSNSTAADQ